MKPRRIILRVLAIAVAPILVASVAVGDVDAKERKEVIAVPVAPDGTIPQSAPVEAPKKKRRRGMRNPAEGTATMKGVPAAEGTETRRRRGMRAPSAVGVAAGSRVNEPGRVVREDVVAVVPPDGRLEGKVVAKDGVTRLPGADLILDHVHFGTQHRVTAGRDGSFEIDLPLGQYSLTIRKRHEVYESPTIYSVPARDVLAVDFLLLRDFESGSGEDTAATVPGRSTAAGGNAGAPVGAGAVAPDRWLPEPPRTPEVVGSVVDLVAPPDDVIRPERRSWRETLGFLGSILLIAIIAL